MTRVCFTVPVLVLLVAVTVSPASASTANSTGIISLQLTDAETSYLGVTLGGDEEGPSCPVRNVRLPVKNDGSNQHRFWVSSIPLQVLSTRFVGDVTEVRVVPSGFNLIGTQPWKDDYESFTYYVRQADRAQPQSLLYFARDVHGAPTLFGGTLYVAVVLYKTDLETDTVSEQALNLALHVDGKWVDEPAVSLLDGDLSAILPFTERDASGKLKADYTCATETHPGGLFCLEISLTLLDALNNQ
jgi:hypothetical protein